MRLNKTDRGRKMRRGLQREPSHSVLDFEKYQYNEPNGRLHFKVEQPGEGYMHPVSKDEVRARLALLPPAFLAQTHTVFMPRMTRKRALLDIYGLQWGYTIYLYPMPVSLKETFKTVSPIRRIEFAKFGASVTDVGHETHVQWTVESIRRFYLDNILVHELGHSIDARNTKELDRERFAEEFVERYGRRK